MATIVDIMRETGLARATVAQVLQGRPGFSTMSRRRVHEAAQRLGYRPNYLSKALSGGKSMSIGAIWPLRGMSGDIDIAMAVLEKAQEKGYVLYQADYPNDVEKIRRTVRDYADRRVDAVLMWSDTATLLALEDDLKALPAIVVANDQPVPKFERDLLVLDRTAAITQVMDHLAASGRRRPAIVLGWSQSQRHKIEWFRECCRRAGMRSGERALVDLKAHRRPRPITAQEQFDKPTLDPELMEDYLYAYQSHFRDGVDVDALLCGTDQGAMMAMRFLQRRGLRVPEDVAVIGWNNVPASVLWTPALATIDRSQNEMIGVLRDMLLDRLASPADPPRHRTVHMKFVWRESAGEPVGGATSDSRLL